MAFCDLDETAGNALCERLGDTAAGTEQFTALVGDLDVRPLPRRQMPFQNIGEVVHVDDSALDAGLGEPVEAVIDQRFAANRDQRFGKMAVVRPHPRSKTRRQHERAFRSQDRPRPAIPRFAAS